MVDKTSGVPSSDQVGQVPASGSEAAIRKHEPSVGQSPPVVPRIRPVGAVPRIAVGPPGMMLCEPDSGAQRPVVVEPAIHE